MTALIQSLAGELPLRSHERTVCEVGNPKPQSWTPPSLHPANPRTPKKCPADPLRVFMSQLCLWATARSHFSSRTPLKQASTLHTSSVHVCFVYTHACLPACMYPLLLCSVWRVHICHFWKGIKGQSVAEGSGKKEKRRCLHEWKGSGKNSGKEQ